jgi:hypothetical protein
MKSTFMRTLIFTASASIAAFALSSTPAGAAYFRHSPQVCTPIDKATTWEHQPELAATNANAESIFLCAIRDDDRRPHGSMVSFHAFVHDRNTFNGEGGTVRVRACVSFSTAIGGDCGTPAATSRTGTGFFDLQVPFAKFAQFPGDFPYVQVDFPKRQIGSSGGASKLFGFQTHYPD